MQLSGLAINQVILDGLVDGEEKRVPLTVLLDVAFQDDNVPRQITAEFKRGLVRDERHKGKVDNHYGYRPEFNGPPEMRPRPEAILKRTAECTEAERQAILGRMEMYAQILFQNHSGPPNPITAKGMRRIFSRAGLELPHVEFRGFWAFMDGDPRFVRDQTSGRGVILLDQTREARPDPLAKPGLDARIEAALSRKGRKAPPGFYRPRKNKL